MGRFINADVVYDFDAGLQGFNLFIYCGNNPINRIDRSGADSDGIADGEDMLDEALLKDGGASGGGKGERGSGAGSVGGTIIVGRGHGNPIHSGRIDSTIAEMAASGNYTEIYGNRALSTAGLSGSWRPDIIAKRTDGTWEVREFASPSQRCGTVGYSMLKSKVELMYAANPSVIFFEIIPW